MAGGVTGVSAGNRTSYDPSPPGRSSISMGRGSAHGSMSSDSGSVSVGLILVVALAELARERNANMPVFRWGVDMDVSDAYLWIEHVRMPHLVALSFWFMTNPIDDQRLRVWIYAIRRHGCM